MGEVLTPRQQKILKTIHRSVATKGYPPAIREIGAAVGLRSPSSVHAQLDTLERRGYIRRDPTHPRAIELTWDPDTELNRSTAPSRRVPLVGDIAAGAPIVAEERVDELYTLPKDLVGEGTLFMLRIRGESMIEAGVLDGDLVVIRQQSRVEQGEMCAALVDGEATVKFFRRTGDGRVFLDPANEAYEPIEVTADVGGTIMGRVVSVLRRL